MEGVKRVAPLPFLYIDSRDVAVRLLPFALSRARLQSQSQKVKRVAPSEIAVDSVKHSQLVGLSRARLQSQSTFDIPARSARSSFAAAYSPGSESVRLRSVAAMLSRFCRCFAA